MTPRRRRALRLAAKQFHTLTLVRRISAVVRRVALATTIAMFPPSAFAAAFGTVNGIVHDPQHRPVPGATVTLAAVHADWKQTTVSGANGEFQFVAVPPGDYTVVVVLDGFDTATLAVTVGSGAGPILHIPLEVARLSQSVTVTAAEGTQAGSVTPATLVSRADIQFTPGADRTNGLEAITAFVPGAYTTHDQLHLRGGHQVSWLVDGVPVPNTNIASNVGPQFDPKDVDYLDVQRGSYDAEYGDRTYGVFNVVPRTGFERDREAELVVSAGSYRQTNDQFNLGGHSERFAYYGSVSANRSDLGLETPVPEVIHDREAGISGFSTLIFNATAQNQLRLVTSARHDAYQIPNDAASEAAGVSANEGESDAFANLSWVRTFTSGALLTVSPFVHWNAANYDGAGLPINTAAHRSSRYIGGQVTVARSTLRNDIQAGVYGFDQRDTQLFAVSSSEGGDFQSRDEPSGQQIAVFVQDRFRPISWLTLTGGIRQTAFRGGVSEDATSPRVGAAVQIPKLGWAVRGFYGRFYQPPPLATVSGPLLDFVTVQNVAFTPLHGERDEEWQVGVTIPVRGWTIDADQFRTSATNFFDHNPVGNSNVFLPLTIDGALIRGWELTVRSPRTWHRGEVHLAYSHQHADGSGGISGGLTDFSPGEGTFPLDHDQRNTLSVGFNASLPRGYFGGANLYYGSGFPDEGGPEYLSGHATVDLVAGKTFGRSWSLSVDVLNVANRRLLIDNSLTFGGTHFNNPREIFGELRYRFHY